MRDVPLEPTAANKVDAAIARALKASLVARDILLIGPPQRTTQATIDMMVHKFGRTTAYRAGRVTSIDTDVSIPYEIGTLSLESQVLIVGLNGQPFYAEGDSGSLILERASGQAVALLFPGSQTHTIANHLGSHG
jgi:hypothetical protein